MLSATQSASACSKTMRWNDDPPFTFSEQDNPDLIKGISIDTVQAIFKKLDCALVLVKMPWARALESLKQGQLDFVSGAFNSLERQEYAHFSSINELSPNILFLRKGEEQAWKLHSLADISGSTFKLGVQINVSYSQEFDRLKEQAEFAEHLHTNTNRMSLWKMLALKRVDGVIADKMTGQIELESLGLQDQIVSSSLIISSEPSFFAFSKLTTNKEFVDRFDKVFSELISDGTIQGINERYFRQ